MTDEEEDTLATINRQHRLISAVESKIEEALDLQLIGETKLPRMTAGQVLKEIGIERPTNAQSKEANVALRTLLGEPTRSKGYHWWRVPWRDPTTPKPSCAFTLPRVGATCGWMKSNRRT